MLQLKTVILTISLFCFTIQEDVDHVFDNEEEKEDGAFI